MAPACPQPDTDQDGIPNQRDNCPYLGNPAQSDSDGDNLGNFCDNCPALANSNQGDADGDGIGDVCDNCSEIFNFEQKDSDYDTIGDLCDACIFDPMNDFDADLLCGDQDNCPYTNNPDQQDLDQNGCGDACETWSVTSLAAELESPYTSMVADKKGFLHASFGYDGLYYAFYDHISWKIQKIDSIGGGQSSIAIDSHHYPHIAYMGFNGRLMHAFFDGTNWTIETVEDSLWGHYSPSIALDSHDRAHIVYSYFDAFSGNLTYAVKNDDTWQIQNINAQEDVVMGLHLLLDSKDRPHIGYCRSKEIFNEVNNDLHYAFFNGTNWIFQAVDNNVNVSYTFSFILDSDNRPHISYSDQNPENSALYYTYFTGDHWEKEVVCSPGSKSSALLMDSSGTLSLVFMNANIDLGLVLARRNSEHRWDMLPIGGIANVDFPISAALDAYDSIHVMYTTPATRIGIYNVEYIGRQ
jgi:hypothetical protein